MSEGANKDLCVELEELSGWGETESSWMIEDLTERVVPSFYQTGKENPDNPVTFCPAYDLGYLLRKLPEEYFLYKRDDWCIGNYRRNDWVHADTPEDAACKLAIELFKQGVLTKASASE